MVFYSGSSVTRTSQESMVKMVKTIPGEVILAYLTEAVFTDEEINKFITETDNETFLTM